MTAGMTFLTFVDGRPDT